MLNSNSALDYGAPGRCIPSLAPQSQRRDGNTLSHTSHVAVSCCHRSVTSGYFSHIFAPDSYLLELPVLGQQYRPPDWKLKAPAR